MFYYLEVPDKKPWFAVSFLRLPGSGVVGLSWSGKKADRLEYLEIRGLFTSLTLIPATPVDRTAIVSISSNEFSKPKNFILLNAST